MTEKYRLFLTAVGLAAGCASLPETPITTTSLQTAPALEETVVQQAEMNRNPVEEEQVEHPGCQFKKDLVDENGKPVNEDYIKDMKKIVDEEGNPFFDCRSIEFFVKNGGTLEYIQRLAALKDRKGKPLFQDGNEILWFTQLDGTEEFANKMSQLHFQGDEQIDGTALVHCLQDGITFEYASAIAEFTAKDDNPIFRVLDMVRYRKAGGTIRFVEELTSITNPNSPEMDPNNSGIPVFGFGHSIVNFYMAGGHLDYVRELIDIKRKDGWHLYNRGMSIFDAFQERVSKEYVSAILEVSERMGCELFSTYINNLARKDVSPQMFETFASIEDRQGEPFFKDIFQICEAKQMGLPITYAQNVAQINDQNGRTKYSTQEALRFWKLGLPIESLRTFQDTQKPNAVIVVGSEDPLGALENEDSIEFFKKVIDTYDTHTRIIEREEQLYEAISEVPDIELLVISGHGSPKGIALGASMVHPLTGTILAYDGNKKEGDAYEIDTKDTELANHLRKMHPDGVIFIYSCETAKGGKDADSIANFVIQAAEGRKVIASLESFGASNIKVSSVYPFDAEIHSHKGVNVTYSNEL